MNRSSKAFHTEGRRHRRHHDEELDEENEIMDDDSQESQDEESDDDIYDDNNEVSDDRFKDKTSNIAKDIDVPIFQRIALINQKNPSDLSSSQRKTSKKRHLNDEESEEVVNMSDLKVKSKKSKNAPLIMKSNRPVSR